MNNARSRTIANSTDAMEDVLQSVSARQASYSSINSLRIEPPISEIIRVDDLEFKASKSTSSGTNVIDLTQSRSQHRAQSAPISTTCIDLTQESYAAHEIHVARKRKKRKRCHSQKIFFRCAICLEDEIQEWKGYSLSKCNHKFCLPCLASHIQSSSTTKVKCPNCPQLMTLIDIQSVLVSVNKTHEWHSYSTKANLELLEKEIVQGNGMEDNQGIEATRRCPAEHCNYIFVYEPQNPEFQEGTRFDCPQCFNSFCLQCGANNGQVGPAHVGNCQDRRQQLMNEEKERLKFEEWRKENLQADARFKALLDKESELGITKPCPGCNFAITKNGGCNHMRCTRCGLDYDWSQAKK